MTNQTRNSTFRRVPPYLLLIACLLTSAVCLATVPKDATWRPDAWVTAKIKVSLLTSHDVSAFDVNVDTIGGHVTLHGKVRTSQERNRAAAIARSVAGVIDVRNLLQVVPEDEVVKIAVRDDALRRAVARALDSDPKLKGSGIRVKSVNEGVVLLSGKASSLMEHLEAIRAASSVNGVRRVASEVQSGDALYDSRLWHDGERGVVKRVGPDESSPPRKEPVADAEEPREIIEDAADGGNPGLTEPGSLPDVMTDASITASIKTRFLEDAEIPALSINIDTKNGIVTLFGQAHSEEARRAAEAHARSVPGVVDVRNEIRVVDSIDEAKAEVTNGPLAKEVEEALAERQPLERCHIKVASFKAGMIRLEGAVPTRELKLAAATIARSVPGVRSVHNELQVVRD